MSNIEMKIEKLSNNNYSTWCTVMKSTLKGKGLYDYIISDKLETPDEKVKNEQAKTVMYCAMTAQQIASTGLCRTARALWTKIKENHEGASSVQRNVAYTEFLKLKHNKNEPISDFAGRFETALGRLESTGREIDDDLKKHVFSHTLPDHMRNTVKMFNMSNPKGSVSELISQLRINHHQESKRDEQATALYAQNGQSNMRKNNQNRGGLNNNKTDQKQCTYCKLNGHLWRECRKLKAENERKRKFGSNQRNNPNRKRNNQTQYRPQGQQRPSYQPKPQQQNNNNGYNKYNNNSGNQKPQTNSGAFTAYYTSTEPNKFSWIIDSGASSHMTPNRYLLDEYEALENPKSITIGDGKCLKAIGKGNVHFQTSEFDGTLTDVLWVPELKANLFSVGRAMDLGCSVEFSQKFAKVYFYRNHEMVLSGSKEEESNYFVLKTWVNGDYVDVGEHAMIGASVEEWHKRLAHCSMDTVKAMLKTDTVNGMKLLNSQKHECEACVMGKLCRAHHPERNRIRANENSAVLHMDTVGPMKTTSLGGARYFVLATEEYSGYLFCDTFASKDQISNGVKQIINRAELESGRPVKQITTDNGSEFKNHELTSWLEKRGTIHDFSAAYTPEQNGRAERSNRTVLEAIRTLLYESKLDKNLWAEALNNVVYTTNRIPSRRNPNKTRYELFRNEKPNISNLRVFGENLIFKDDNSEGKLGQRGTRGVFVGYTNRFNTYRVYIEEPYPQIYESCNVKFLPKNLETKPENKSDEVSISLDTLTNNKNEPRGPSNNENPLDDNDTCNNIEDYDTSLDEADDNEQQYTTADESSELEGLEVREIDRQKQHETAREVLANESGRQTRSTRNLTNVDLKVIAKEASNKLNPARKSGPKSAHFAYYTLDDEPRTIEDAKARDDWPEWQKAMDEELDALNKNETWDLVDRPSNVKPVKNKWVFKIKLTPTGEIERYKARLVAKGFTQIENVDYKETYAPVAGMNVIRLFLSIVNRHKMKMIQFDIKTAFLYGDLEETIYMEYPGGYPNPMNRVCKLKKSLYGLKQAPRNWNSKFNEFLEKFNLKRSENDKCFYYNTDKTLLLVIYVDDALVASRNEYMMRTLIKHLETNFQLKTMECKMFLGIEIDHDRENQMITLTQPNYINKVLERFNMQDCNSTSTPEQVGAKLESDEHLDPEYPFKELVGSLLYLATCTRPDIAHAISMASRTSTPTIAHWQALKQILRYLKGTPNYGIRFRWENNNELIGYSDADYANDSSRKSNTGYCIFYGGGPIAWRCQKQPIITLSTTEAEFVAGCDLVKEVIPIRNHLIELGEIPDDQPAQILIDNQSTIKIATNEGAHQRTKHIDVRDKWITEQAANKRIKISHIRGEEQVADILTKPLHKTKFAYNRSKLLVAATALVAIMAIMSPTDAQRKLKEVDDLILTKSDYVVVNEDDRNYLKLIFVNPCDLFLNYTGTIRQTEKLISNCYEQFTKKHLGPINQCRQLETIGPNLTFIPTNYNCALDLGPKALLDSKCEFSRNRASTESDLQLSQVQEDWNKYKRRINNIPLIRKKRIPLLLPLIGLWAGIVTGGTIKAYDMGKTNAEDIQTVVNVTNEHTKILQDSTKYYEILRDKIILMSDWVADSEEKLNGNEFNGRQAFLIRNITREFDQNEILIKDINSAASVKKVPSSLSIFEYDKNNQGVNKSTLHDCWFGLENKNAVVYLDFSIPNIDEKSEVLEVHAIDHYTIESGQDDSEPQYCYNTYIGPDYVLYNKTTECMTGLLTHKVFDKTVRAQTCIPTKNDLYDRPSNNWKALNCSTHPPLPDESKVIIHMYEGTHKIYCYPGNITIQDEPEQECPMNSFILESNARFTIGNITHTGNAFKTNITRKTRAADRRSNKKLPTLDDNFDQKCEPNPPDIDGRGNPHVTVEIHLSSPDDEESIGEKGRRYPDDNVENNNRFKRSPLPTAGSSFNLPPQYRENRLEETTERPRIKVGEKLRNLSQDLNLSLDSFKERVNKLGNLTITKPDFDTLIDTPINMINDGYEWIITHLKSITSLIGFLTGCMIFVMILPLVELAIFGVKVAKVPISIWISSVKRAIRRARDLKKEVEESIPFKSQQTDWTKDDKYL